MKKLFYLMMVTTLFIGTQSVIANGISSNETADGPSLSTPVGSVKVTYDNEQEQLNITLSTEGKTERATVYVANPSGVIIAKEVLIIDNRGTDLKISLEGERKGLFHVKVQSRSIRYSEKINTK